MTPLNRNVLKLPRLAAVLAVGALFSAACIEQSGSDPDTAEAGTLNAPSDDVLLLGQITHDPVFEDWATQMVGITNGAALKAATLNAEDRAAYIEQLTKARDLCAEANTKGTGYAQCEGALVLALGIDRQQMIAWVQSGLAFGEAYPAALDQTQSFHGQAMQSNDGAREAVDEQVTTVTGPRGSNGPPPEDDEDKQIDDCEDDCYDAYKSKTDRIFAEFAIRGTLCVAMAPLTLFWGTLACMAELAAEKAIALAAANQEYDDCIAICNGWEPDNECKSDPDCDDDEFCHKGPLTIGDNVCKPKKANGKVCSRDGKCKSGCCKYHFLSHPLSMVCRPANKCN